MFGTGIGHYIPLAAYLGFWIMSLISLGGRPLLGLYYMLPFLPYRLLRDHFIDYPLGANMMTILVMSVIAGALIRGKRLPKSKLYRSGLLLQSISISRCGLASRCKCPRATLALRRQLRYMERLHGDSAGLCSRRLSHRRPDSY